ncbi:hypothetical protein N9L68_02200 [bacterium]|nr:hypothetical protein [bacterium]
MVNHSAKGSEDGTITEKQGARNHTTNKEQNNSTRAPSIVRKMPRRKPPARTKTL